MLPFMFPSVAISQSLRRPALAVICERSSCSSQYSLIPPSPRLVGIEPNPGPPKLLLGGGQVRRDLVDSAVILGQALASHSMNNKVKKKKKQKNTRQSLPRSVSAPVAMAYPSSARVSSMTGHIVSIPFQGMDIKVSTDVTGSNVFSGPLRFSDGIVNTIFGLNLQPNRLIHTGGGAHHPAAFGYAANNLASCFTSFRIRDLKAEFISYLPTSTPGVIALGAMNDPSVKNAPSDLQTVGSCEYNIINSLWASSSLNLTSLVRSEKFYYIRDDTSNTDLENERFNAPGVLIGYFECPSGIGSGAPLGLLRFSGTLEFKGMSTVNLLASTQSDTSSSSSSSSSVSNSSSTPGGASGITSSGSTEAKFDVPDGFCLVKIP